MSGEMIRMIVIGIWETLYMTVISTFFAYVLGIPLGVLLLVTRPKHILTNNALYQSLGVLVNIVRSVPFLILMITIAPLTRLIVGTTIGSRATIVSLIIAAAPFIGRMVEASLMEVEPGVIEAAQSMGARPMTIITKVLLPEAMPSLLAGATIATGTILAYSAMAGAIGGGGLGAIAINYGYVRWKTDILMITVVLLIIIVQLIQVIGGKLVVKVDKRQK